LKIHKALPGRIRNSVGIKEQAPTWGSIRTFIYTRNEISEKARRKIKGEMKNEDQNVNARFSSGGSGNGGHASGSIRCY
jgi:hypothetical protein